MNSQAYQILQRKKELQNRINEYHNNQLSSQPRNSVVVGVALSEKEQLNSALNPSGLSNAGHTNLTNSKTGAGIKPDTIKLNFRYNPKKLKNGGKLKLIV